MNWRERAGKKDPKEEGLVIESALDIHRVRNMGGVIGGVSNGGG